ncbi:MAG TPA: pyridoxal-phosphate dependent enzyme, partial [Elusimicrobiota bacterium]|nr:pyridoxal-phosphate dependent enzyme [Elusimicrobiota bacterium]
EESQGTAVEVSDGEIFEAQGILARTAGVFAEPSAAAALAGLVALKKQGLVANKERVVCLVTGNGLKDVQSVLERLGEPPRVEPRWEAVQEVLGALSQKRDTAVIE